MKLFFLFQDLLLNIGPNRCISQLWHFRTLQATFQSILLGIKVSTRPWVYWELIKMIVKKESWLPWQLLTFEDHLCISFTKCNSLYLWPYYHWLYRSWFALQHPLHCRLPGPLHQYRHVLRCGCLLEGHILRCGCLLEGLIFSVVRLSFFFNCFPLFPIRKSFYCCVN